MAYLLARTTRMLIVLLGLTLVVFVLLQLSGDPASVLAPPTATVEDRERIREDFGLNDSLPEQYARFAINAVRGDFGDSWKYRQPALQLVLGRMPATIELALAAVLIAIGFGGVLGVLSAANRGRPIDVAAVGISVVARAMPSFWLGLMLILLFAVQLGWLPTSGRGTPLHLILPALTLAAAFLADVLLLTRGGMLAVLDEEYIRTARAKGLGETLIHVRHALPNAALPVVSAIGLIFARLIGGAVVTETVFAWPGVGSIAVEALAARDFPLVEASVIVLGLAVALISLLTDLAYGLLDPRIRHA
ncbi:MAG: ABC transporter permease [Deltaproteobacteria bacterium]|nr:ABC transporter permease [Deltaproteobacteria bacterium]